MAPSYTALPPSSMPSTQGYPGMSGYPGMTTGGDPFTNLTPQQQAYLIQMLQNNGGLPNTNLSLLPGSNPSMTGYGSPQTLSYNQWLASQGISPSAGAQGSQSGGLSGLTSGVAGGYAANKGGGLINYLTKGSTSTPAAPAASDASAAAPSLSSLADSNGMITMADGSQVPLSDFAGGGSSLSSSLSAAQPYLGAAGAALGTGMAVNDWQHGQSGRAGMTMAGAGIGSFFGPIGTAAGAVGANLGGYALSGNNAHQKEVGALVLPPELAIAHDVFGWSPIHKTTRQVQQENTQKLLAQNPNDATYQNYVSGMRAQNNAPPPDPSNPYDGGKFATWDAYQKAGLDAGDLEGVDANLGLGASYTDASEAEKRAVTQAEIDAGQYKQDHGETVFADQDKANAIAQSIMQSYGAAPAGAAPAAPSVTAPAITRPATPVNPPIIPTAMLASAPVQGAPVAPIMIPRSSTRSPGINLDGSRINYARH